MSFRLFVYGTLRRGGRYHDDYRSSITSVTEATVVARHSELPAGYPVIDVPPEHVLAIGGHDPEADVRLLTTLEPVVPIATGSWDDVAGEILVLDDPARHLPSLDALEEFRPGSPSLYRRVALPVQPLVGATTVAWAYVRGDRTLPPRESRSELDPRR